MGQWKHRITNVDEKRKVGDCTECGTNVKLKIKRRSNGYVRFACSRSENRWCKSTVTKNRRIRQLRIIMSREYKSSPCIDCKNVFDPVCMDFDHVTGDKLDNISEMIRKGRPLKIILQEISKCELVCACCHRLRTKNRLEKKKM